MLTITRIRELTALANTDPSAAVVAAETEAVESILPMIISEWPAGGWVLTINTSGMEIPYAHPMGDGKYYFKSRAHAVAGLHWANKRERLEVLRASPQHIRHTLLTEATP